MEKESLHDYLQAQPGSTFGGRWRRDGDAQEQGVYGDEPDPESGGGQLNQGGSCLRE